MNKHLSHQTDGPVISCRQLCKDFQIGNQKVPVLKGIDLDIQPGDQLSIVGASGSGKSTFLQLLGGLDTPSHGEVKIQGITVTSMNETERGQLRNQSLGFIYQFHHLLPEFSALENVAMPLLIRRMKREDSHEQAAEILDKVGLSHRLSHLPSELSGGERQRVAVARALVTRPACVLADEPTGNLDNNSASSLFELIQELNTSLNISFVIVTHDLTLAARMPKQMQLTEGQLKPC